MTIGSCVLDTNILLRMTRRADPEHELVTSALSQLTSQGTTLHYTHQNVAELWNVMTRPIARNGLGLTIHEAESEVLAIERGMTCLPDGEAVYHEWRKIILRYGVSGVQVHDARLAATMHVHGVPHILTLNLADFSRFEGITPLHPNQL